MDFSAAFQMDLARCLVLSVVQAMLSRLLEKSHNSLHNTTGELCTLKMYVPCSTLPNPSPHPITHCTTYPTLLEGHKFIIFFKTVTCLPSLNIGITFSYPTLCMINCTLGC